MIEREELMMFIPELQLGQIGTDGLRQAVSVLGLCKVAEPCWLSLSIFAPGGQYGAQWWQLDGAIALDGYKVVWTQALLKMVCAISWRFKKRMAEFRFGVRTSCRRELLHPKGTD